MKCVEITLKNLYLETGAVSVKEFSFIDLFL